MAAALCGAIIKSKRALLALGWSIVVVLTIVAFVMAFVFTAQNNGYASNYYDDENKNKKNGAEVVVTSRALAFAAIWTAILAGVMAVFGAVVLGIQSPTGKYYHCCAKSVHATSQLSIGAFVGSLLMFSNVTLVCSVLFSEFEVRDSDKNKNNEGNQDQAEQSVETSSMAFSVICMFLTVLYAGYAALVFAFSDQLLQENEDDDRDEKLSPSDPERPHAYHGGRVRYQSEDSG